MLEKVKSTDATMLFNYYPYHLRVICTKIITPFQSLCQILLNEKRFLCFFKPNGEKFKQKLLVVVQKGNKNIIIRALTFGLLCFIVNPLGKWHPH